MWFGKRESEADLGGCFWMWVFCDGLIAMINGAWEAEERRLFIDVLETAPRVETSTRVRSSHSPSANVRKV